MRGPDETIAKGFAVPSSHPHLVAISTWFVGMVCGMFAAALPEPKPQQAPPSAVDRVIDGDTICVDVQLVGDVWLRKAPMRLYGINCPEMNTAEGKAAKAFTESWLAANAEQVELSKDRDKYGRLLGDFVAGKERLTAALLKAGHAAKVDY